MGKLNRHVYPDLTLNEALDLIKRINEVGGVISPTGLARMIGIDARGAGLHSRIEDLKQYQLIEANGDIRISPLGKSILEGEIGKAWEAFVNIPLYSEMHARLGEKEPPDKVALKHILYEITKANDEDISRRVNRLKNNYIEGLGYFNAVSFEFRTSTDAKLPSGGIVIETGLPPTGQNRSKGSFPNMDSDFYLVDKRGTPYFIGIDTAKKADFAIDYLKEAKNSLPGGTKGKAGKTIKPSEPE